MLVFVVNITLYLPYCHSLKEKRGVLKSMIVRTRQKFNISMIESGYQDSWQSAMISIGLLTNEHAFGSQQLEAIKKFLSSSFPDVEVTKMELEIL